MSRCAEFEGFGFAGYRSFGAELTKIAPLKKINFIIGQNNSGKSNIINFLKHHLPLFYGLAKGEIRNLREKKSAFEDIDKPILSPPAKPKIAFPLARTDLDKYIFEKIKICKGSVCAASA